jgi:hypothetical protein
MRTGDILAPSNSPPVEHARAFQRRSAVIGAMAAAGLIVIALASAYSARSTQAVISDSDQSEPSAFAKSLERSGTLSGLEILF